MELILRLTWAAVRQQPFRCARIYRFYPLSSSPLSPLYSARVIYPTVFFSNYERMHGYERSVKLGVGYSNNV